MEKKKTLDLENAEIPLHWAKLASLNEENYETLLLYKDETTIGRLETNDISIPDKRLSGVHLKIIRETNENNAEENKYFVEDLSLNGTYVNDKRIGKNKKSEVKEGNIVFLLHETKVQKEEVKGYTFRLTAQQKIKRKESNNSNTELKKIKTDQSLGENLKCMICFDYMFQAVTLFDCLHSFCGSCYSDWMKRSKECPHCREQVYAVKKNAQLNSIINEFLEKNPTKKRSNSEYKKMEENNNITMNKLVVQEKKKGPATRQKSQRKEETQQSRQSVNTYSRTNVCFECTIPRVSDGFKCEKKQIHYICANCQKKFPNRNSNFYPQSCMICNTPYCNLYLPPCNGTRSSKLTLLKDFKIPNTLEKDLFCGNDFEFKIYSDYLKKKKMNGVNVFNLVARKLMDKKQFKYLMSSRIMKNYTSTTEAEISIMDDSPVCSECFDPLWFQIVIQFCKLVKNELPEALGKRPNCWYGIGCRTMNHNKSHCEKYNHMVEQTDKKKEK